MNVTDPDADRYVALVGEGATYVEYDVVVRTRNRLGLGPITDASRNRIFSAMGSEYRYSAVHNSRLCTIMFMHNYISTRMFMHYNYVYVLSMSQIVT